MKLTESQRRAIEHNGRNLQLIACAGSGKTEVVARRVVHLLTPGRVDSLTPKNIVAFTFTEKAAAELKERVVTRTRAALGEDHRLGRDVRRYNPLFLPRVAEIGIAEAPEV